jgi:hypothetical protein
LQVDRDRKARTLRIYQTDYTKKVLERFGIKRANRIDLPAPASTMLRQKARDESTISLSLEKRLLY